MSDAVWLFGYGSLIWRPDFDYIEKRPAQVSGWQRRFWQGSHDHRGTPDAPGRVVTMIPDQASHCGGMAYLIDASIVSETFEQLDHREKNGYERFDVVLEFQDGNDVGGRVYIAPIDNFAWLGEAPLEAIAHQIAISEGPSGLNSEYLLQLAEALRTLGYQDDHVFKLDARVRDILER